MVGADRYDDAGGAPAPPGPMGAAVGEAPGAVGLEPAPDPDSYWANIDYPPARPQFVKPPIDTGERRRQARQRSLTAAIVAGALVLASGSYLVGRANGHAPVAGLNRRITALEQTIASQRAQLKSQAATIAVDRDQVRRLRDQASASLTTVTTCQRALDDADRAFGIESAALTALANSDLTTADALTTQFGAEADRYSSAAHDCRASSTAV